MMLRRQAALSVWVCSDCGEQITESHYDPERGTVYGHYHDPPAGWHTEDGPHREDPWFDAEQIAVVPTVLLNELADYFEIIDLPSEVYDRVVRDLRRC